MYKIIYEKENGDVFERIRNTLPNTAIGETSSMGWLVKDILYKFKNNYYTYSEYSRLMSKVRIKIITKNKIKNYFLKYKDAIIIILAIYITKLTI